MAKQTLILKLTFISDPSHGWLQVPHTLLKEMGITDKISHYSYQNMKYAFLEEDLDYSVFTLSCKKGGYKLTVVNEYQENTFIRSLPSYKG